MLAGVKVLKCESELRDDIDDDSLRHGGAAALVFLHHLLEVTATGVFHYDAKVAPVEKRVLTMHDVGVMQSTHQYSLLQALLLLRRLGRERNLLHDVRSARHLMLHEEAGSEAALADGLYSLVAVHRECVSSTFFFFDFSVVVVVVVVVVGFCCRRFVYYLIYDKKKKFWSVCVSGAVVVVVVVERAV